MSPSTAAEWQQLAQHYLQQPPDPRTATLALACYQKALALAPDSLDLWLGLARACQKLGQAAQADAACAEALKRHPRSVTAQWLRCIVQLPILYQTPDEVISSRRRYSEQLTQLIAETNLSDPQVLAEAAACVGQYKPFYLAYQDEDDVALQRGYGDFVCRIMAARYPAWATCAPVTSTCGRPLRIGFVSAHFRTHTVWDGILGGWLTNLDRQQFACYGYALDSDEDAVTATARRHCTRFVQGLSGFAQWCETIAQDQLDVLIYPEVGEHTMATRLATLRLAPVQCTTWGHCVTSGLPTMDYFLSADLFEPADGASHYTEQLIRLPNLSTYFTLPTAPTDQAQRQDFGLRAGVPLYLSLQSLFKHLPQYDTLYPQIAQQVGDCQFVFMKDNRTATITNQFEQRLARAFASYGLDWQRYVVMLRRLPMADYHALQAVGDVYLDSIGWNGGTTTFNALAHNLPVVTLLRYFNVYGSRQSLCNPYSGLVAHFYARLRTKQPLLLYEKGTPGRDFVHVRDVVYANLLALTTPLPPALCLNIGSGQCHSLYELAATLIAVTGLNSPLQPTDYYRVGDIHTCYADLRCAQQWLGYHPQVDLCAGLQEFATWAKQQNGTLV